MYLVSDGGGGRVGLDVLDVDDVDLDASPVLLDVL